MKIADVMTTKVRTVRSDTLLKEAAEILAKERISGLPVVDGEGHVVGVLSEGDILLKEAGSREPRGFLQRLLTLPGFDLDLSLGARTVGEAMSAPAVTIGPKRTVAEAASTMIDQGVKRLPVVDWSGRLVGIVTRADLVRAFVRTDAEISTEIRDDVLRRTLLRADEAINVVVKNGEVGLSGEVETKNDAELILAFVQRVPGVVSVQSMLRWHEKNGERRGRLLTRHKQP